jgi:DNA-binding beta-propeller fold protein YncE
VIVSKYEISFTPRVRGPHKLATKINGQEIPGSPFDMFARIDPTHLGFVIRQSGEAGKPYGIALTPDGLLVTAGNGSKSLRFWSRDLKEVGDPIHCQVFHFPRGVACGAEPGVVYSSDKGVEKSRDYTIMKFVNGVLDKGTSYGSRNVRFIRIIRGLLYGADENTSQVHRYSPDTLDHISTFNVAGKATDPHDIAEFDNHLYVLGSQKIAIYSFDDWKFVANVPLAVPMALMRGFSFDRSNNIFITQAGSGMKGVYVFRPTGELVTVFGQHMEFPLGIVIDGDGFVYVTDHREKNRRIFAF